MILPTLPPQTNEYNIAYGQSDAEHLVHIIGKLNIRQWLGCEPGTCMICGADYKDKEDGSQIFSVRVAYRAGGWRPTFLVIDTPLMPGPTQWMHRRIWKMRVYDAIDYSGLRFDLDLDT